MEGKKSKTGRGTARKRAKIRRASATFGSGQTDYPAMPSTVMGVGSAQQ
jgi:hypothetical protein